MGLYATALALVPGAFAYWTSSGEGAGTVKSANGSSPFEVSSSPVEGLGPGASATVAVRVKDTNLSVAEFLTVLEAEAGEPSVAGCKSEWFEVTPALREIKLLVAPGETREYTVSVRMREEPSVNQNACKGALLTLRFKVS